MSKTSPVVPEKVLKRKLSEKSSTTKKKTKSNTSSEPLLTIKELCKETGLTEFMLTVAMDLLDKSRPLTLIDIVCPSQNIRVLNQEAIDASRHLSEGKKKKVATDDEVRKFIVEKREKTLQSEGVRIAGSDLQEKMSNTQKDDTLVSEFLGYARTTRNYFVYAYYVGPSGSNLATELRNPVNWLPVHKMHLGPFHRRIRDVKPYYRHTSYDQVESKLTGGVPLYDPRFIMHKWLAKDGQAHKALLDRHRPLFAKEKDFLIKHYEEDQEANGGGALYYYDENKADSLMIDLSMDVVVEQDGGGVGGVFNAEQDRQRQQARGYRLTDKEVCHVNIDEFPSLSRIPLPQEIDLSMTEFLGISQHTYVNEKRLRPPEDFICDPLVMTKAALMALNFEMQIKRVLPLVGDAKLQILEADNVKPILDYMGSHKSCTNAVKDATFRSLLSFMAVEAMTREPPPHIKEALEKIGGEELVLLDS